MSRLTLICTRQGSRGSPSIMTFPDASIREVVYSSGTIEVFLNVPAEYHSEVYVAQAMDKLPDLGGTNIDRYKDWIAS